MVLSALIKGKDVILCATSGCSVADLSHKRDRVAHTTYTHNLTSCWSTTQRVKLDVCWVWIRCSIGCREIRDAVGNIQCQLQLAPLRCASQSSLNAETASPFRSSTAVHHASLTAHAHQMLVPSSSRRLLDTLLSTPLSSPLSIRLLRTLGVAQLHNT